jgi:hypothetical protein
MACFAYTVDETNYMADVLLPEATDLESTQMIRMGGTKYMEQFWDHKGVTLRAKAVEPQGEARDFTWITTELARRTGLLDKYVKAINKGISGVAPLKSEGYDYSLDPAGDLAPEKIWDAVCRAATITLSEGREEHDLAWFKENGFYTVPMSRLEWYLTPTMEQHGLRYELPYQERLMRAGRELGRRLHEQKMNWWDEQLSEYTALPEWHDVPGRWIRQPGKGRRQGGGFPLLAADHQEHAVPRRRQCRDRGHARSGAEPARPCRRDHECEDRGGRWASPRATASRCAPTSAPPTARRRWCRACGPTRWSSSASSTTGPRPSPRPWKPPASTASRRCRWT